MIKNYFKIAWRNLSRNKVYSIINMLGLSIGLSAAMLILLYSKDEVSYDRFHENNPNIYRVVNQWSNPDGSVKSKDGNTGHFQGPKFKEGIAEIREFVRVKSDFRNIKQNQEVKSEEMLAADSTFFSVFTFPMLSGDPHTALKNPKSIVISEEMAEKYFHSTDVLGKYLEISEDDKFVQYQITGVSKKCPQNSSIKFNFLLPNIVAAEEYKNGDNWFNFFQNTFVLIDPKATQSQVEAKMKLVFEKDSRDAYKRMQDQFGVKEKVSYLLQPMSAMHLSTDYVATNGLQDASNPVFSYLLGGIAAFILLIACINFINLTVARSLKRAKEIGVRKVVGSNRKQLIWQFMSESFLLCFASFIFALVLVQIVLPKFNFLANKSLALSYLFDYKLIAGYFLLFIITSFLSGFYPAIVLSGFSPVATLYGRFMLSGKNLLQKSLVVLQFGLASFLIISTLTIFSQFNFLTKKELGYEDKNLILVGKWNLTHQEARLFRDELLQNPDIVETASKNGGSWGTIAKVNGEKQMNFAYETVDTRYIPLLKIKVLQGRNFSPDYPTDSTQSVIVNETFVKQAGWKNPIGQTVNFWYDNNAKYQVIGVVKDHHFASVNQSIEPQLFTMKPGNQYGMMFVKIKPGSETKTLKHIEASFKKLFPLNSYDFKIKESENLKNYESEAKWKQIMLFGAILTIFISCIGLFGLATLSAEKRMKEIGIRKVMGATVSSVVALLSKDFLKLVALSFLFSFPLAYFASTKWLENYPYRENFNFMIMVFTALVTIVVALLTVSWHSIKTALMNPVKSLKTE
ncbi:MAG: ABC transporter permease [Cytophagaceae bacterium]|nr:ABC transporter permease [Cytophagaceae bacterium]MBL0301365.1 ABC transporter permease [Cytophagaceae bacterium]MBL0324184.1 ABC transporter permease [Cytophagaceae bacterium]